MRAVVQRVTQASVTVGAQTVGKINRGLLVLVGVETDDTEADVRYMADKLPNLRIFEDDKGLSNLSVLDIKGSILAVSQFTLLGDARKGRRPGYTNAQRPELAEPLFEQLKALLKEKLPVESGVFGADMAVSLVNDGPFTILLSSKKEF